MAGEDDDDEGEVVQVQGNKLVGLALFSRQLV